ncbi:MAG: tetratricopeptide repeat protein [Bacteroidales bacterium]
MQIKRIFFIAFAGIILFGCYATTAQSTDSLINLIDSRHGKSKINLLLEISEAYLNTSVESSLKYAQLALEDAKDIDYEQGKAKAYFYIGHAYNLMNTHELAIHNYKRSLELYNAMNDRVSLAEVNGRLAIVYYKISGYDEALNYANNALSINLQIQDSNRISDAYNTLGLIYWKLGNLDRALENYFLSLDYSAEDNHNTINNIAIIYGVQGNYEKALAYQFRALEKRRELGLNIGVAGSLNNVGIIYNRLNKPDTALVYFLEALKIRQEIGQPWRLAGAYNNVGSIYESMAEYDTALYYYRRSLQYSNEAENAYEFANTLLNMGNVFMEKGKYDSARIYLEDGVLLSDRIQAMTLLRNGYFSLYDLNERVGDFENALEYYKVYSIVKDSLYSEQSRNKIADLRIKYETEEKQREIELLRKTDSIKNLKLSRERNIRYLLSIIILLVIALIIFVYSRYAGRKKTNRMLTDKNIQINKINRDLRKLNSELENRVKDRTRNLQEEVNERKQAENIQRILFRIARAANTVASLKELVEVVRKEVSRILELKNFYIALYERESNSLSLPYFIDEKDDFTDFPEGNSLTWLVINKRQLLLLKHNDILQMINSGEIDQMGTVPRVWLGVPLLSEDRIIGAFVVQHYDNENAFSNREITVLEFIADQIGILIERKSSEDKLRQAKEQAEESDRLKTAFLTNMSHEIRTPMNAIIGFSNLLLKPNLGDDKKNEYLNIIKSNTSALLKIIDDIIDTARIEVGEIRMEDENLPVNKMLEELTMLFAQEKTRQGKHDVELRIKKYVDDDTFSVRTDPYRVRQVITNLLSNALKFVEKGYIEIGYTIKGTVLEFYVKDTGIGISKEKQLLIFDRFRQAEESYTRKYGGTGLGLSISKSLVRMLGGDMWVESRVNEGSTFFFTIAYHPVDHRSVENDDPKKAVGNVEYDWQDKTFLVAEDVKSNFELVKELLEITAARILWVKDGLEAIRMCEQNESIDLVIMDISMPKLDGLSAAIEIKKNRPELPIIAVTAFARNEEKEKFLKSGCDDYIAKPVNEDELLQSIYRFLNS